MKGQNTSNKVSKHERAIKAEVMRMRRKLNFLVEQVKELQEQMANLDDAYETYEEVKLDELEEQKFDMKAFKRSVGR